MSIVQQAAALGFDPQYAEADRHGIFSLNPGDGATLADARQVIGASSALALEASSPKAASATAGTSRRGPSEKHILGGTLLWWIQLAAVFQTRHRPWLARHNIIVEGKR